PVFGEMSMFSDEPRSATVGAASDCVLFEVTRRSFEAICARDPRLGLELTRRIAVMLASRVRKGNDDVLKLSTALSIALSR
nr:cyclic nucleotide-binding domain-containing protein [Spirochaetales bacterium]